MEICYLKDGLGGEVTMAKQRSKHAIRSGRGAANRFAGQVKAKRAGILALSGLWLAASPAHAVTPLNTYFGPGLPIDNYFPEGIPGAATEPGVTVRTRARPEYNSEGITAGAFTIRPGIDEQIGYDSNVVGGTINGKGSSELLSAAGVSVNSNYSRNNFGISGNVNNATFFDVPRMSHTDYNVSFGGGLNLGRDVLDLSVSYMNANEEPYDIGALGSNFVQLTKPLNFSLTDFRASYTTQVGRFTLTPNVDYQLLRLAHGDFIGIPVGSENSFDQTLRDSNILQGGVIARYEFQPQRNAVIVINGNYNTYTHGDQPNIGVVSSTGVSVLAGLDYQLTGATTFRALAGYQQRFFNASNVSNQGAPIGEADFIWNPTGLTTVTAQYARTIEDATTDTVTGFTYDRFNLVVDHELFRNILLQGHVRFENASYQGSNLQQRNYGGGGGVTYMVNRNVQVAMSYEFIEHTGTNGTVFPSNVGTLAAIPDSFGQHVVFFHVRFGL
jgi:hypothetical protein